jgi:radical SAM superfamily enzyme YgiQ (UPF0313 family)
VRRKVLLYNPRAVFYTMPLALVAVGSALDPARYEVVIVDGRLEADPVAALLAQAEGALCLGLSVLTGAPLRDALQVTRAVKAARPDLPIVWGGWHPSLFPEQCLSEPAVDAVVVGQGEATFAEVVERLAAKESLAGVAGTAHRDTEAAFRLPPSALSLVEPPRPLRDLNSFPPHNYDLIPVERFFGLKGRRQFDYISSQGCRFRCTFCADPFVYKRGWTAFSPERVARELTSWWQRHHFEEIAFQDETFFTSRARVEEIAEAFVAAKLPVEWTATLRADQGHRLDDAAWARARRAGLKRVMIGIESGSQAMLDWMKKDIQVEQVFECAEQCLRHGIGAIFNIIVGFPGEPPESVQESLRAARRLRALSPEFTVAIFYYRPYPGNEIADQLLREGYRFPQTLEEWADFDYVGGTGPWVDRAKFDLVERFKFYQKHAYGPPPHFTRWPLRAAARWRVNRNFYSFPLEKAIVERLRPAQRLS